MEKEFVMIWTRYETLFAQYSDEEVGRLLRAMIRYRISGEDPEFTGNERFVWPAVKSDMDRAEEVREKRCQKNSENGAKGGRPRKGSPAKEAAETPSPEKKSPAKRKTAEESSGEASANLPLEKTEKTQPVSLDLEETQKRQIERKREKERENSAPPKSPNGKKDRIREVKSLYRALCPHLLPLSEESSRERDRAVSLLLESRDLDACAQIFKRADASGFLRGEGRNRWKAGFDWLIKPESIAKLLEGQYDDGIPPSGRSYDLDELEEYWKNNIPTL